MTTASPPSSDWVKTVSQWPYGAAAGEANTGEDCGRDELDDDVFDDEDAEDDAEQDDDLQDGEDPATDDSPVSGDELYGEPFGSSAAAITPVPQDEQAPHPTQRFDAKIALGIAAAAVVALLVMVIGGVYAFSGSEEKSEVIPAAGVTLVPPPAATTAAAESPQGTDKPLPYDAECFKCPKGSSPGQAIATGPLIIVRKGLDGQVIKIYLGSKEKRRPFRVTGIAFEPGALTQDSQGKDQWDQYRVASLVQFNFNDADHTPIPKETGNVHGEVTVDVPNLLASEITIIIRQSSRPPKTPPPTGSTPAPGQGVLTGILTDGVPQGGPDDGSDLFGPGGGPQVPGDPVDAKVAIGNLKIIGHEPL